MKNVFTTILDALPGSRFSDLPQSARTAIREWQRNGSPSPPPHPLKQHNLRSIARRHRLKALVETGTFYGDMIEALKQDFDTIYSIELSDELHKKAVHRFADQTHVELIHGDSGQVLQALLTRITTPTLFWLDGHYSAGVTARGPKDSPILEELSHIFDSPDLGHVIVVDDARLFGVEPGYPTVDALSEYVRDRRPDTRIAVVDDAIRITPR